MSEKKRSRKRKEYTGPGEEPQVEKPSKDEIKVAKWLKKNVKTKKTKFCGHNVEYFTSNKAIDALLKTKFAEGDSPLFTTREHVVEYLDIMLEHKFFHRAKKVPITVETKTAKKEEKEKSEAVEKSEKSEKSSKKEEKKPNNTTTETTEAAEHSANNGGGASDENGGGVGGGSGGAATPSSGEKKEKKKKKIRLEMHGEQVFVDGSEAYVWIYDPIPIHYWIYGLIVLLGAIVICMFPLWPAMLRKGVYYLSIAAAGFLVFIFGLTIIRLIIFTIVWALTGGKLHFWIFPNLTEDVGFFASFCPLYESKYIAEEEEKGSKSKKSSKAKSKKSKDKDSDNEDNEDNDDAAADAEPLEPEKIEEIKEHDADILLRHRKVGGGGVKGDTEDESHSGSSSANEAAQESESAKCSQNHSESESDGKDYEIISSSEVQNVK